MDRARGNISGRWLALLLAGMLGWACHMGPAAAAPLLSAGQELQIAERLDAEGNAAAVDHYYRAALQSGRALQVVDPASPQGAPHWQVYYSALRGLVVAGQKFGRLQPCRGLTVHDGAPRTIPIVYRGFAWRPADFSRLELAEEDQSNELTHHFVEPGLGLPLVGVRVAPTADEKFFRQQQPFAVTAVLRPGGQVEGDGPALVAQEATLEFYNPCALACTQWCGARQPLARDLSAPLSAVIIEEPRQYLRGFTAPTDVRVKPKLVMAEPYQRGKIPVVFIHGMYSDPITWADALNYLRSQMDLYGRFQFWLYRYPTGGAVLESAAELRSNLQLARAVYDPDHTDPALDAMVLVGHSLGGLVAKLQVVESRDLLWKQAAYRPLEEVRTTPDIRLRLSRDFFFEPVPGVSRVVFIGTPHRGSGMARRLSGRLGSSLVRYSGEVKDQYRELMAANRDIFRPEIQRSRPTSVNLVEPTNPFLLALLDMPITRCAPYHTIAGTYIDLPWGEPSDGVVPLSSARLAGAQSELFVPASHEHLHRDDESVAELARILRQHAASPMR